MNYNWYSARPNRDPASQQPQLTRRRFLTFGVMAATAALMPRTALSADTNTFLGEKSLIFYNTHTGETLKSVYWAEGRYLGGSLRAINHILRDPRNNEIHDIDIRLLDLLFSLRRELDTSQPFHVISGYRSPETNAFLRAHSSGVAENSLHLIGQAIDIRSPGRHLRSLQNAAIALRGGGVGYYPKSDFVHIDVGRVRYW